MPIALDQFHRQRLAFVKQLYNVATIQAQTRHSIMHRTMAVISFDLAVETSIRLIVGYKPNTRRDKDSGFHNVVQEVSDLYS